MGGKSLFLINHNSLKCILPDFLVTKNRTEWWIFLQFSICTSRLKFRQSWENLQIVNSVCVCGGGGLRHGIPTMISKSFYLTVLKVRDFRRNWMCLCLTYFLVLIQNELRVICDWLKSMRMFTSLGPLLHYLLAHLWRHYLPALLALIEPSWHCIIPLKSNKPQDYAVCPSF